MIFVFVRFLFSVIKWIWCFRFLVFLYFVKLVLFLFTMIILLSVLILLSFLAILYFIFGKTVILWSVFYTVSVAFLLRRKPVLNWRISLIIIPFYFFIFKCFLYWLRSFLRNLDFLITQKFFHFQNLINLF